MKKTKKEIAERIGVSVKTIQREVKRGTVELLNSDLVIRKEYVTELSHERYKKKQKAKESALKIGKTQELADEVEIFFKLRKKSLPHQKKYKRVERKEDQCASTLSFILLY